MYLRRAIAVVPALAAAALILVFGSGVAAGFRTRAMPHGRMARVHNATHRAGRQGTGQHAAPDQCANANTVATAASREAMRDAVVCLINAQRAIHHLPAMHAQAQLNRSAQGWTDVMVDTGQFTHGQDFASRITAVGYPWSAAGENIATGFLTPRAAVKAWMASPDHCENILDPTYSDVGTGLNTHRLGQYGASTWTQDFGLSIGHKAPSINHGPQHGCPYTI